jgi:hypothetical protein
MGVHKSPYNKERESCMIKKCPGCQSIFVCWNWVPASQNHQSWSHECWACGTCFSTDTKIVDGISYEQLNSPESKVAVEIERNKIVCHKLKDNDFFIRLCDSIDNEGKWTRSESAWDQVTCDECLALR